MRKPYFLSFILKGCAKICSIHIIDIKCLKNPSKILHFAICIGQFALGKGVLYNLLWSSLFASGAEFLQVYPDARGSVFGPAMAGLASGEEGVYWNPAGLLLSNRTKISGTHGEWFQGSRFEYITFNLYKNRVGNFGFSTKAMYFLDIERKTRWTLQPEGTYKALFLNTNISYQRELFKKFSLGLTGKIIYQSIDKDNAYSFAGDLGVLYILPIAKARIGLTIKNIGTPVKFIKEKDPLPLSINSGIIYQTKTENLSIGLGYTYTIPDKWGGFSIGAEYALWDLLIFRAGWISLYQDIEGFKGVNFSAGLKIHSFQLDYAYSPFGFLGNAHRWTLSYTPGIERERKVELEKMLLVKSRKELMEKEKLTSLAHYEEGSTAYESGDYEKARKSLDIALIWDPDNEKAKRLLTMVEIKLIARELARLFQKARKLAKEKKYPEALEKINNILEEDSTNIEAINLKDSIHQVIENISKERLRKIREKKEEADKLFKDGVKFYQEGKFLKAIASWESLLKIFPEHEEAKNYIVQAKKEITERYNKYIKEAKEIMEKDGLDKAFILVKKALELNPDGESARELYRTIQREYQEQANKWIEEGKSLYAQGKSEEAYSAFLKARRYLPRDEEVQTYIQKIEREQKERGIDIDKLYLLGIQAYIKDDFKTAIEYWGKVIQIAPEYPNAKKNYERALAKLKELERG